MWRSVGGEFLLLDLLLLKKTLRERRDGGRERVGMEEFVILMHCVHFLVILPSSSNLQVTGCAKVWKLGGFSLVYTHIVQLQNAPGSCGKWTPFIRKVSLFGRTLTAFPSKPSECPDSSLLSYKYNECYFNSTYIYSYCCSIGIARALWY